MGLNVMQKARKTAEALGLPVYVGLAKVGRTWTYVITDVMPVEPLYRVGADGTSTWIGRAPGSPTPTAPRTAPCSAG